MNKKAQIKAGLFFGILMTLFYISRALLFRDNLTTAEILASIGGGLIGGAVSGLLFGWLMGLFANSKSVKNAIKIQTAPGETIIFEGPANHFKGMEGVGGKLYLTNQNLIFQSHKFNIQNHKLSIPLSEIEFVERYKTMGILNNGLMIIAKGKKEKFVVENAGEWENRLEGQGTSNQEL